MSLLSQKNVGGNTVSSSSASLSENELVVDTDSSQWDAFLNYETDILATVGLPNIVFWFVSEEDPGDPTTGSWEIKFSAATRTQNGQPLFENIIKVAAPPTSVPLIYSFEYPCIAIKANIKAPQALTNGVTSISYTLSAYGP